MSSLATDDDPDDPIETSSQENEETVEKKAHARFIDDDGKWIPSRTRRTARTKSRKSCSAAINKAVRDNDMKALRAAVRDTYELEATHVTRKIRYALLKKGKYVAYRVMMWSRAEMLRADISMHEWALCMLKGDALTFMCALLTYRPPVFNAYGMIAGKITTIERELFGSKLKDIVKFWCHPSNGWRDRVKKCVWDASTPNLVAIIWATPQVSRARLLFGHTSNTPTTHVKRSHHEYMRIFKAIGCHVLCSCAVRQHIVDKAVESSDGPMLHALSDLVGGDILLCGDDIEYLPYDLTRYVVANDTRIPRCAFVRDKDDVKFMALHGYARHAVMENLRVIDASCEMIDSPNKVFPSRYGGDKRYALMVECVRRDFVKSHAHSMEVVFDHANINAAGMASLLTSRVVRFLCSDLHSYVRMVLCSDDSAFRAMTRMGVKREKKATKKKMSTITVTPPRGLNAITAKSSDRRVVLYYTPVLVHPVGNSHTAMDKKKKKRHANGDICGVSMEQRRDKNKRAGVTVLAKDCTISPVLSEMLNRMDTADIHIPIVNMKTPQTLQKLADYLTRKKGIVCAPLSICVRRKDDIMEHMVAQSTNKYHGKSHTPDDVKWVDELWKSTAMKNVERALFYDLFIMANALGLECLVDLLAAKVFTVLVSPWSLTPKQLVDAIKPRQMGSKRSSDSEPSDTQSSSATPKKKKPRIR